MVRCHTSPGATGHRRRLVCVLLHGSWSGAWVWEGFQRFLAGEGYPSIAPDLRGHGDQAAPAGERRSGGGRVRWLPTLGDYARDVAHALRGHLEPGAPFVFVAHSLATRVVLRYLQRQRGEGWPLPAGIVLMAPMPPRGALASALRLLRSPLHGPAVRKALLRLDMGHVVGTAEGAHRLLRHEVEATREEREAFHASLGGEALIAYGQAALPATRATRRAARRLREAGVRVLVMGAEGEPIVRRDEVEQTARLYGADRCRVFPGVSHDLMFHTDRDDVAGCLRSWLEQADRQCQAGQAGQAG